VLRFGYLKYETTPKYHSFFLDQTGCLRPAAGLNLEPIRFRSESTLINPILNVLQFHSKSKACHSVYNLEEEIKKAKKAAAATVTKSEKSERMNIRIPPNDLRHLKIKAMEEGMPYQTLVSSIIHKYLIGRLQEQGEQKLEIFISKLGTGSLWNPTHPGALPSRRNDSFGDKDRGCRNCKTSGAQTTFCTSSTRRHGRCGTL
jgi:predicted DNA binding CopG/RHH family protein